MTPSTRRLLVRVPLALTTVMLLLACAAPALRAQSAQPSRLAMDVSPRRALYDPGRKVNITVILLDAYGDRLEEDGVAVYFHATLGHLPKVAYTVRGQVRVSLENPTGPGQAIVTATAGSVQTSEIVEFLGQGGAPSAPTSARPRYRLQGEQVYYGVDVRVFDLAGSAVFTAPAFTVTADQLQYDVEENVLTAQRNVTITAGDRSVTAQQARLELARNEGYLLTLVPDIGYYEVALPALELESSETACVVNYQPLEARPTNTAIVCREATLYPREQIQFRRPKFYVDIWDRCLLSMPYHVVDLRESTAGKIFNSEITLTSDAGVNVDFPVYYAANDRHTGALHLRQVTRSSPLYRGKEGLQVGIEEEYFLGSAGEGVLYLDDLTNETRSYGWRHHHDFGMTSVDMDAAYERTVESPYTLRLGTTVRHAIGGADVNLRSNYRAYEDDRDLSGEVSLSFPPIRLGNTGAALLVSPYAGMRHKLIYQQLDPNLDPDARLREERREYYQGLALGLGVPVYRVFGGTLATSLRNDITHRGDGTFANYLDADISFRRPLTRHLVSTLTYSYSLTTGDDENGQRQFLYAGLTGRDPNRWGLRLYADYDLERETLYGTAYLTYYLPWDTGKDGHRRWFVSYEGNANFDDDTTADHLLSLGRQIGVYNVLVHYSPSGNTGVTGIGSGTGKEWAIEFVRQGW